MRVAVTGASGLVGSALVPALEAEGHEVLRLVRRAPSGPHEVRWDPAAGTIDAGALGGVDAFVHLAGETIGQRWTPRARERILASRVDGTSLVATTAATLDPRPGVLVSAGGVGFYGDRGDEELTETSAQGTGFLAEVAAAWEHAAQPARDAGVRVVHLRQGIVLSRRGGALERLYTPFRLGAGGRIGSGRQWWSWVALDDAVAAYVHALTTPVSGPVNVASPELVRNAAFVKALGRALGRPAVVPLPAFAVRLAFGRMGDEMLLGGQRALPAVLERSGFRFAHPALDDALARAVRG